MVETKNSSTGLDFTLRNDGGSAHVCFQITMHPTKQRERERESGWRWHTQSYPHLHLESTSVCLPAMWSSERWEEESVSQQEGKDLRKQRLRERQRERGRERERKQKAKTIAEWEMLLQSFRERTNQYTRTHTTPTHQQHNAAGLPSSCVTSIIFTHCDEFLCSQKTSLNHSVWTIFLFL